MFAIIALIAFIIVAVVVLLDAIIAFGLGAGAKDMYTLELAAKLTRR